MLKLIDFGQSIDLNFFDENTAFTAKTDTENFICTEMMEDKPWNYQIDLFCLASTIYTIVCGKYMNVKRTSSSFWRRYTIAEPIPKHLNEPLWLNVIHSLVNVRDCDSMPNLQTVKASIKEALLCHERFLEEKIKRFNQAID